MWSTNSKRSVDEKKVLNWQDFPMETPPDGEVTAPYIASHLRRLLEKYEESEFIQYLVAPSPTALSGFFHCKESDIYEALHELERQGYQAETAGDFGPILLWDPLIRLKTIRHQDPASTWHLFYDMIMQPSNKSAAS
jgi:hypothetical protein